MSKELVEIVRCKNCIHRPTKGEDVHDIDPPKDSRGYDDYSCPCLNEDDYWYSWYPSDEWFCANGEAKDACSECEFFSDSRFYADNSILVSWGSCMKCQRNMTTTNPYQETPEWCPMKGD